MATFDRDIEYFVFSHPKGLCFVGMLRGLSVSVVDNIDHIYAEHPRWDLILKWHAKVKGDIRRDVYDPRERYGR